MDPLDQTANAGAAERAQAYRAQAEAHRQHAAAEPLPQRRRVLALSAARYGYLADVEEKILWESQKHLLTRPQDDFPLGGEAPPSPL
jgi:hypothetical protein